MESDKMRKIDDINKASTSTLNETEFITWKSQIDDVRSKMKHRFTVSRVEVSEKGLREICAHNISRSRGNSRTLETDEKLNLSSTESSGTKEKEKEISMALVPVSSSSWAVQPYTNTGNSLPLVQHSNSLSGVPSSLVPVVLPKGTRTPPRTLPQKSSSSNPFSKMLVLPHGATLPPLHDTTGRHHHLVLNKLMESKRNIEYGTSDGTTVKVYSSRTSSQMLESGSLQDSPSFSREEIHRNERRSHHSGKRRAHWRSKLQFILSCVGACVGLGSFWRIPYLCLAYGRVAFLVPYSIIFFLGGVPLLLAEFVLGQYTQRGPIGAMKRICPLMQGVGIGVVVISLFASVYYSLIFSESILSLAMVLSEPFVLCNASKTLFCTTEEFELLKTTNSTNDRPSWNNGEGFTLLGHSDPKTQAVVTLVVTLTVSWLVVYFALWKSVRSIGKVTAVSATVPFILISAFTWRALTLPGATVGLQYLFKPQWDILLESEVWVAAGVQVLVSMNIVLGSSVTFASYNKFWNKLTTDVWLIMIISCLSSLLALLVVFSGIGNIAYETGLDIEEINFQGTDLAFVVYPQILSKMPHKHIWAALFFLLLLLLGIDSQFASVEVIVTSVSDSLEEKNSKLWIFTFLKRIFSNHQILVLIITVICFFCSLPFVVRGHALFPHMQNFQPMNVAFLSLALCEVIALVSLFGAFRLKKSVLQMTAKQPSHFYMYCWHIFTPLLFLILWVMSWMSFQLPSFHSEYGTIQLIPIIFGWTFATFSILPVPVYACISIYRVESGSLREKLTAALTPDIKAYPNFPIPKKHQKSFWSFLKFFSSSYRKKAKSPRRYQNH